MSAPVLWRAGRAAPQHKSGDMRCSTQTSEDGTRRSMLNASHAVRHTCIIRCDLHDAIRGVLRNCLCVRGVLRWNRNTLVAALGLPIDPSMAPELLSPGRGATEMVPG